MKPIVWTRRKANSLTPAQMQIRVPSSSSAHPSSGVRKKILGQKQTDLTAASRVERWDHVPANQVGRLSMVINMRDPSFAWAYQQRHQRRLRQVRQVQGTGFMASTKRGYAASYKLWRSSETTTPKAFRKWREQYATPEFVIFCDELYINLKNPCRIRLINIARFRIKKNRIKICY